MAALFQRGRDCTVVCSIGPTAVPTPLSANARSGKVRCIYRISAGVVVVVTTAAFDGVLPEEAAEFGVVEADAHADDTEGGCGDESLVSAEPVEAARGDGGGVAVFVGVGLSGECSGEGDGSDDVAVSVADLEDRGRPGDDDATEVGGVVASGHGPGPVR